MPALEIGQLQNRDYQAPRNELEQVLADIWAEVLKVQKVGIGDNFFELGGHSLLATQIASRVQKSLQREVPLRAMFKCSTVEQLAEYIEGLAASEITEDKVDRLNDLMAELQGFSFQRRRGPHREQGQNAHLGPRIFASLSGEGAPCCCCSSPLSSM